ncbi:MAG: BrxA/BrxB family bacilliredoxin [Bacteroidetes bacterium]|nr:MAG: BrxA/BrxB family bacilliredoxin [Bacteroidota bacterium]
MARISLDSIIGQNGPNYSEAIAAPYREELVNSGFQQMLTPEEIDNVLDKNDDKVVLVVLNSVCGCSARVARPGTLLSLFNNVVPDVLATTFAGMEKDAVAHFRTKYLPGLTPSSPNIALFKNGKLIHILHRYQIERSSAVEIADELINVYNDQCSHSNEGEEREKLREFFKAKYNVDPLNLPTE